MTKKNAHILVVDDDMDILVSARILLKSYFSKISICNDPKELDAWLTGNDIQAVLLDMNYQKGKNDGKEGLYWLKRILEIRQDCAVVMMTAYGDVLKAVESLKAGAADYLLKPWDSEKLPQLLATAIQLHAKNKKDNQPEASPSASLPETPALVTGKSLQALMRTIQKVAPTDASILLLGENGTGKQVFAEYLHRHSARKEAPFVHVDMGSISPSLFESALFGHAKGAFTDAREARAGYFEQADGGTIFLDEIGNIPAEQQTKLLQVLQSHIVYRLGESQPRRINVRIITATNSALEEMVRTGTFRQDLFYRINTIQLQLPPLRERREDLPALSAHFLRLYNAKYHQHKSLGSDALALMQQYSWPGNVRELMHVIERAVILSEKECISPIDLNLDLSTSWPLTTDREDTGMDIEQMEKMMVLKALQKHDGNVSRAAIELGLSRNALYRRMEKYGL